MKRTLIAPCLAVAVSALGQQSPKPSTNNLEARIDLERVPGPYVADAACVENMVSACMKMHIANGLDASILKPDKTSVVEMLIAADQLTFERSHCSTSLYIGPNAKVEGFEGTPKLETQTATFPKNGAVVKLAENVGYELNGTDFVKPKCVALIGWSHLFSQPYRYEAFRARFNPICRPLVTANLSALRCIVPMPGAEIVKVWRDSVLKVQGTMPSPASPVGQPIAPARAEN